MEKRTRKKCAVLDRAVCVACGACAKVCKKDAIEIVRGCFAKIDPERCVGCGLCAKVCPASLIEVQIL